MRNPKEATAVLLLFVLAVGNACSSGADRCEGADRIGLEIERIAHDPSQRLLDLREVAGFAWETIDAFGEYSPVERVEARTGLRYRESWWQDIHVRESHTLLVFSDDRGPLCYLETKNPKAPGASWSFGASIFREDGVPAAQARFTIDRAGELPILEWKER